MTVPGDFDWDHHSSETFLDPEVSQFFLKGWIVTD